MLDLGGQVDLSCAKKIVLGKPSIRTGCGSSDQVNDAGLCYPSCKDGYHGVGPVCWSTVPDGWVDCGLGAAKSVQDCLDVVTSQVTSVVQLAFNLGTLALGGEGAAEDLVSEDTEQELGDYKKLLKGFKAILKAYPKIKQDIEDGKSKHLTAEELLGLDALTKPADIVRVSTQIAALFDPTGIAGVIAAYSYPTCGSSS